SYWDAAPVAAPAKDGCPHTSYPGDSECLEAPPAGTGFQLHYGPSDHSDPTEVQRYVVPPNTEVIDCIRLRVPGDGDTYFREYHVRSRPGLVDVKVFAVGAGDEPKEFAACGRQSPKLFLRSGG